MTNELTVYRPKNIKRRPSHELAKRVAKIEYLTEPEYVVLCQTTTHPEHKLLIRLLWETGLRISEALSLKYGDIYPDGINIVGKGYKQRMVHCQAPILGELLRYARSHSNDRIFQKVRTRGAAWAMIKRLQQKAGISKRLHPHIFRHSYAINFIKQTGNPWALQTQGGWSDMDIIKTYMRLASEMPQEAVDKMYFPEV